MQRINFDMRLRKDKIAHFTFGAFIYASLITGKHLPVIFMFNAILAYFGLISIVYLFKKLSKKEKHFVLLSVGSGVLYSIFYCLSFIYPVFYMALGLSITIGVYKEICDYLFPTIHTCDIGDAIYTSLGGLFIVIGGLLL